MFATNALPKSDKAVEHWANAYSNGGGPYIGGALEYGSTKWQVGSKPRSCFETGSVAAARWGRSPEALEYLKKRGIEPDLIYIDAFKKRIDVDVALDLFPDAVVCGDDWNWKNSEGEMQMQENVLGVAKERGLSVVADRATWILNADEPRQK